MELEPKKEKKPLESKLEKKKHQDKKKPSPDKKGLFSATKTLAIATITALTVGGFILFPIPAPEKDYVSDSKKQEIIQVYEDEMRNSKPLQAITSAEEQLQAIKSMGLNPDNENQLLEQVKNNELKLVWFQVWDNQAEDGDVLEFESQGYRVNTMLRNEPVVFALPVSIGNSVITITGMKDGGGGITSSVVTSFGTVIPPVINVGDKFTMVVK